MLGDYFPTCIVSGRKWRTSSHPWKQKEQLQMFYALTINSKDQQEEEKEKKPFWARMDKRKQ